MSPSTLRLLSFVALGAVLPLLGIYALLMYISTPSALGGIDIFMATVSYVALTGIFGVMITVAINFYRQLGRQAKGLHQMPS